MLRSLYDDLRREAKDVDIEQVVCYIYPELHFSPRGTVVSGYDGRTQTSRVIDRRKNVFYNNAETGSEQFDTIETCKRFGHMTFNEALEFLTNRNIETEKKIIFEKCRKFEDQQKEFEMPEKNIYKGKYNTYYASKYLREERAIPEYIVSACMSGEKPLIMQDNRGNCVFLGYNEENEAKYAAKRGTRTYTDKNTGETVSFKRDAPGSDKSYSFKLVGNDTSTIYVTEAAIDALSLAALHDVFSEKMGTYRDKTYISTGGAGIDNAVERFCDTHDVKVINVCFDNDDAGFRGMKKIKDKYESKGYVVNDMRSTLAHDYNDLLIKVMRIPNYLAQLKEAKEIVAKRQSPDYER